MAEAGQASAWSIGIDISLAKISKIKDHQIELRAKPLCKGFVAQILWPVILVHCPTWKRFFKKLDNIFWAIVWLWISLQNLESNKWLGRIRHSHRFQEFREEVILDLLFIDPVNKMLFGFENQCWSAHYFKFHNKEYIEEKIRCRSARGRARRSLLSSKRNLSESGDHWFQSAETTHSNDWNCCVMEEMSKK